MVQFKAKCHEDNVVGPSTYVRDVADLKGNQSNIRGKDKSELPNAGTEFQSYLKLNIQIDFKHMG